MTDARWLTVEVDDNPLPKCAGLSRLTTNEELVNS
jgi:hypothetical protein